MEIYNILNYIKDSIINIFLSLLSFLYFLLGIKKDNNKKKEGFGGLDKKIKDLKNKVKKYKNQVKDYGNQVGDHANKVTNYTNQVGNYTNEVSGYANKISGYENDITNIGNKVSGYTNKIGGFKDDIVKYGNKISGFKDDIANYGNKISGYTNKIGEYKSKIGELGNTITDLGTRIGGVVVDAANITKNSLLDFVNKIKGIIGSLALDRLKGLIRMAIRPLIKELNNTIKSLLNNMVLKPYNVIKKSAEKLFGLIKEAVEQVKSIPNIILDFFNKLTEFFSNLGKNISNSIVQPVFNSIKSLGVIFTSIFEILLIIINKILEIPNCVFAYAYIGCNHVYEKQLKPELPGFIVLILDTIINLSYTISRPIVSLLNNYFGYNVETDYIEKCTRIDFEKPLNNMKNAIGTIIPSFKPVDTNFKHSVNLDDVNKIKVNPVKIKNDDIYSAPLDILNMTNSIKEQIVNDIEFDNQIQNEIKNEVVSQFKRQDEEAKKLKTEQMVLQKASEVALQGLNSAKYALGKTTKAKEVAESGLNYTKGALKETQRLKDLALTGLNATKETLRKALAVYNVAIANLKYTQALLKESRKALEVAQRALEKSKKALRAAEKALKAAIAAADAARKEAERLAREAAAAAEAAAKAAAEAAKREAERIAREAEAAAKAAAEAARRAKEEAERRAREAAEAARREAERVAAEAKAAAEAAAAKAAAEAAAAAQKAKEEADRVARETAAAAGNAAGAVGGAIGGAVNKGVGKLLR